MKARALPAAAAARSIKNLLPATTGCFLARGRVDDRASQLPASRYILMSCSRRIHHIDPWSQLLWETRVNQINIEEALGCSGGMLGGSREAEGNKQGAAVCAIYLPVIDD